MDKLINDFSYGLFFWQSLLFIVLLLLLKKFAWKPILNAINEREEGIKNALEEAENARKEMQNLTADNERILKEARIERDTLLKEAREMKENIISEAKGAAQIQATKVIEQAQATIQAEKQAAITDLKNQVAELSLGIAEKVVREELSDKNKQIKLVEDMLKEVTIS
ncbi:ATP F0F1 synthase subunit B [Lutibacter profundi]|uniref:ATP synthase subunit b n=1 Tax=Lutibacter profundi TaxID=1622118 RepID=A0A0X8G8Z7_9FLAO|nr:F0F1 ATP synthase subunit B [Lutibacter profundi]AMC12228.1 ATP F0F1 synthase subunit B [Lutibacter profundi]